MKKVIWTIFIIGCITSLAVYPGSMVYKDIKDNIDGAHTKNYTERSTHIYLSLLAIAIMIGSIGFLQTAYNETRWDNERTNK